MNVERLHFCTYVKKLRDAWDAAFEARSRHFRAHAQQRAWHPLGTEERAAADLRYRRELARLDDAERATRIRLSEALVHLGYRPLPSGLYETVPRKAVGAGNAP